MKKSINQSFCVIAILFFSFSAFALAQENTLDEANQNYRGNCTSIMVGRLATTDGSVITSHTCDGMYRTWLEIFPHSKYEKGTAHSV